MIGIQEGDIAEKKLLEAEGTMKVWINRNGDNPHDRPTKRMHLWSLETKGPH